MSPASMGDLPMASKYPRKLKGKENMFSCKISQIVVVLYKGIYWDTWTLLCVTIWVLAGAANAAPAPWPTAEPAGSVALTRSRSVKVKLLPLRNHHILHVIGKQISVFLLLPTLGCSVKVLSFFSSEKLQVLLAWGTSAWTACPASSPSRVQKSQLSRAC